MEENYRIQEFIESKKFDELTNEERTIVLKEISEEEYSIRKSVIDQTRLFLSQVGAGLEPKMEIKDKVAFLLNKKANRKKKFTLASILTYKVSIFVPIAATVLLLLILPYAIESPVEKEYIADVNDTIVRVVYKTDTVVMEKEIIKPVQVIKYIVKETQSNNSDILINQGQDRIEKTNPAIVIENTRTLLEKQFKQNGKSSGDMTEFGSLLKIRGTLNYLP